MAWRGSVVRLVRAWAIESALHDAVAAGLKRALISAYPVSCGFVVGKSQIVMRRRTGGRGAPRSPDWCCWPCCAADRSCSVQPLRSSHPRDWGARCPWHPTAHRCGLRMVVRRTTDVSFSSCRRGASVSLRSLSASGRSHARMERRSAEP